ncbi:translation initiation factor IF-2 subunit gamma [Vulcanisaeta souniana]|uniref:protein-synthesizing GTPase n=1 Tax=Vulcanisaeta souniana JCM 11219 TaxID=1293586 RepID=A0A830EEB5_9CREN|nr:translation initiation factor IF-2 subunit gamma [Vulcanisaeta souniana]BDR92300.1 translation initiation factor IF-2 subunit gamma [Vulcanisaeta souniana JCM 11219]GGI74535.1 translation initiation factor IF-2 subunit gamma [Vulcanisaeta souniana JCM 11219]
MSRYIYPDAIIATAGHVDHGKTTLVHALSGVWVARYSEEIKRAMTVKLGYITIGLYECQSMEGEFRIISDGLLKDGKCPNGDEPVLKRKVSILDVPGHEVLISTMISGISYIDAAMLVVDASMPVPQPQTEEHFTALTIMGLNKLIVAQNKLDLVSKEQALDNYKQIKRFLGNTWAKNSPIIPVSSLHRINIEAISSLIDQLVPPREVSSGDFRMLVLRSFNVNKPGTTPDKLIGGVLGGTVTKGSAKVGDEIEIRPGLKLGNKYEPIITKIVSIAIGNEYIEEARPGGLVGIGTELDPALTKADSLVGSVVGKPGTLPPVWSEMTLEFSRIEMPSNSSLKDVTFKPKDIVMIHVGSAAVMGIVKGFHGGKLDVTLRKAVSTEQSSKVVITKQVNNRWRIVGYGILKDGNVVLE